MPVLFMGGEPADFLPYGNVSWNGAYGRRPYSRGALYVERQSVGAHFANEWLAEFREPSSEFWTSWWLDGTQIDLSLNPDRPHIGWRSPDGKVRVALGFDNAFRVRVLSGTGVDGAPMVPVATSQHANGWQSDSRFDVYIKLNGAASRVKVFIKSVLHLDYTGPLGADATEISQLSLGNGYGWAGGWHYWSEVFATTFDSRSLTMFTHPPTDNGTTSEWEGSYTDIDDADWSSASDVITTEETPVTSTFQIKDLPAGQNSVRAFKLSGVFSRGIDALPNAVRLGVAQGSTLSFSETHDVDTGITWLKQYWEHNPTTGLIWSQEDINQLQIAIRSEGYVSGELPNVFDAEFEAGAYGEGDFSPEIPGEFTGSGLSSNEFGNEP